MEIAEVWCVDSLSIPFAAEWWLLEKEEQVQRMRSLRWSDLRNRPMIFTSLNVALRFFSIETSVPVLLEHEPNPGQSI